MKTILVVEDDPHQGLLYEETLGDEGYRVLRVTNGREAVQMAQQDRPDCVVLDLNLPVMDGLEVLGQLLKQQPRLPVVINTAYSAYRDNFMSWAASDYVVKSSDLTELTMRIKEALEKEALEATPVQSTKAQTTKAGV